MGALALAVLLVAGAQVPNALAAPTFTLEDADAALAFPPSDTLIALIGAAKSLKRDACLSFPPEALLTLSGTRKLERIPSH